MARSCKGLKLPVNSDKIRTNYVRAVSQTGDGGGGSFHICLYTYLRVRGFGRLYMLYHRKIKLVCDYTKVAQ